MEFILRFIIGNIVQKKPWNSYKNKLSIVDYISLNDSMFHFFYYFFYKSSYSEERTKTIQYILHQREQIDQLTDDKQSVKYFLIHQYSHFHLFI